MNKTYGILLFLLFLVPVRDIRAQEKVQLKVLCYNLRFGELATLEELAAFINQYDPDVVALQEVDVRTHRTRAPHQNGKDFITELGYHTGMLSLYGKTIPHAGGYYGIGILTKYPYISAKRLLLPMPEGGKEQRGVLISEIELPGGQLLTFACTHLDHSTSDVRKAQVDFINRELLQSANPVILCGDFNARPESEEIARNMKHWLQACNMDFTIPADAPRGKIDYIFCYPTAKWKIVRSETPVVQLSDHLPIISTLTLDVSK